MSPCRQLSPAASESGQPPEKFEALLARLEEIVADMENGEMPLEKLLQSYEEGMRLVKTCGDRLADAEQKVEILSRSLPPETLKASSAPAESAPDATPSSSEGEPADEIRLF